MQDTSGSPSHNNDQGRKGLKNILGGRLDILAQPADQKRDSPRKFRWVGLTIIHSSWDCFQGPVHFLNSIRIDSVDFFRSRRAASPG